MVNPHDFDGKSRGPTRGKGERFEGPQHGAEALRLAAEFERKMKQNMGIGLGDMGIWERLHEITRDH